MIDLMQFWFFSGFLLAGAAWSVDTLLRGSGVQLRGVWVTAIGLTLLSPVLPRLGSFAAPGTGEVLPSVVANAPQVAGSRLSLAEVVTMPVQSVLPDGLVLAAWTILSAALVGFGIFVLIRLQRRTRLWRAARVRGEDVLVSSDFGPAVVGFGRPAIVLPEELVQSAGSDLDLILRHEREHIEARDPWLLLAAVGVVACMPWNLPLVWQATRLRAAVEEDCDIRVLRSGACRRTYGDLLVRMASWSSGFGFVAAAMSERRSGLKRRLERLADQRGQTRVAVTALLVIAGAGAIGVWMGMPSPVLLWGGNAGHLVPVVAPTAPLAPAVPAAPIPPLPPTPPTRPIALGMPAVVLARLQARYLEMNAENTSTLAELEHALDRAVRDRDAHKRLLKEIQSRSEEVEARRRGATNRSGMPLANSTGLKPIIYVNGEPFPGELADLNPEDILRVEVVKGEAARKLHGSNAAGGVVNIYLRTNGGSGSN